MITKKYWQMGNNPVSCKHVKFFLSSMWIDFHNTLLTYVEDEYYIDGRRNLIWTYNLVGYLLYGQLVLWWDLNFLCGIRAKLSHVWSQNIYTHAMSPIDIYIYIIKTMWDIYYIHKLNSHGEYVVHEGIASFKSYWLLF